MLNYCLELDKSECCRTYPTVDSSLTHLFHCRTSRAVTTRVTALGIYDTLYHSWRNDRDTDYESTSATVD